MLVNIQRTEESNEINWTKSILRKSFVEPKIKCYKTGFEYLSQYNLKYNQCTYCVFMRSVKSSSRRVSLVVLIYISYSYFPTDICYLDHTGCPQYPESLIRASLCNLTSNVYGNPHSGGLSSKFCLDSVDQIRFRYNTHEFTHVFLQMFCNVSLEQVQKYKIVNNVMSTGLKGTH